MRKIISIEGLPCHYCPAPATTRDHIVPQGLGGPNTARNLVPCCEPCNQRKGMTRTRCGCNQCAQALLLWWPLDAEHLTQRIVIPGYELGSELWT